MYKILHLFRIEKFTEGYIKFINNNFDKRYHELWTYGKRDSRIVCVSQYKNAKYFRNIKEIGNSYNLEKMYSFDKIIYHGVFDPYIVSLFFKNRRLLKRLYLYFWGGDKPCEGTWSDNFKKKYVVKHAHGIINIIPEEKKYMKKTYGIRNNWYCAKYYDTGIMEAIDKAKSKKHDYIAIQVGNSATGTNAHIFILKQLAKFRNENLKIFVPLSYGDKEYANKVIKIGRKIFGEKFVGMTDFMNQEEYYQFLNSMDVAVFALKRQQALGNITALLYFGKKVFLRDRTILSHYHERMSNCYVGKIEEIGKMEFDQFIAISEEDRLRNKESMQKELEIEPRIEEWTAIFNDTL